MEKQKYIKTKADVHRAIKTKAAEHGIAMEDLVDKILRNALGMTDKNKKIMLDEETK